MARELRRRLCCTAPRHRLVATITSLQSPYMYQAALSHIFPSWSINNGSHLSLQHFQVLALLEAMIAAALRLAAFTMAADDVMHLTETNLGQAANGMTRVP